MARILIGNIKGPQGPQGKQGEQGIQGIQGKPGPLPPLTNTALATVPGISALDAVMGKTLQDQITKQNSHLADLQSKNKNIEISVDANTCTVVSVVRFVQSGNAGIITGVVKAKATAGSVLSVPNIGSIGSQTGISYQNMSLAKSCRYKLQNNSKVWAELTLYDMEIGIDYSFTIPFLIS